MYFEWLILDFILNPGFIHECQRQKHKFENQIKLEVEDRADNN